MISDFCSNAILTKVLSKYGQRLRKKDYQSLVSCSNISQVAAYLKNNTSYRDILKDINEYDIHRGYLERKVSNRIFADMASVFAYSTSSAKYFSEFIILSIITKKLIRALVRIESYEATNVYMQVPNFVKKSVHIDFAALDKAQNYDEFLQAIRHTDYYKILKPIEFETDGTLNIPKLENVIYTYFYTKIISHIDKIADAKTKKELVDFMTEIINAQNYVNIVRLKKLYKAAPDKILDLIIPMGFFKTKKGKLAIDTPNFDEFCNVLADTSVCKKFEKYDCSYDELVYKIEYKNARKNIRFSASPTVIAYSYFILMEIELLNIIHIVEGVRYGISKEDIEKLLITKYTNQ
ncbi:MAG: V-type ATPase subunit [Clostridia bacterium]|nr:V-type ATPase subunit [Clostridia bacterium]